MEKFAQPSLRRNSDGYENEVSQVATGESSLHRQTRRNDSGASSSCRAGTFWHRFAGITDSIVAVEMTGVYHRPVQRAFRQAGFDTRTVHPFASKHFRGPFHPNSKTDDHDLEAIFHAAIKGYGLATLPVDETY